MVAWAQVLVVLFAVLGVVLAIVSGVLSNTRKRLGLAIGAAGLFAPLLVGLTGTVVGVIETAIAAQAAPAGTTEEVWSVGLQSAMMPTYLSLCSVCSVLIFFGASWWLAYSYLYDYGRKARAKGPRAGSRLDDQEPLGDGLEHPGGQQRDQGH